MGKVSSIVCVAAANGGIREAKVTGWDATHKTSISLRRAKQYGILSNASSLD
jgi:hypothetical protein